ncbi:MAG: hypothetical protein IPN37_17725 [Betaproteobacteria bacterium]|nr:hypothetical protein [Betaproteobacteria bacterium]
MTAREFHATQKVGWSDHYAKRWMERLEKDIFPWLGKLPLSPDRRTVMLQTLRSASRHVARELPHSLLEACGQVFPDTASRPDVVSAAPRRICAAH